MPPPNKPGTVASRGPIIPQKFFVPPQPEPPGNVISEEDGDWWVSVFQCGAVVTLAAALSVAATTSVASQVAVQQQDDKGNLSATIDEHFWQNPTLPVAGSLIYPQQFSFDPNDISAAGNTTAVYSSGSAPTVILQGSQRLVYTFEEITVTHSAIQPEEDFWTPQIPPVQWKYLQPFTDDVVIVPQPVVFQPDEDFWQNPAPPPVTFAWPQQFSFDQNDISAAGNAPAVYSSGSPPTVILQGVGRIVLSFPDETIPSQAAAFQPDEDFWLNPVSPVPLAFAPFQPWVDEQAPLLFGQPDEDFWANPTAPVAGSLLWPQQWTFDEETPALSATVDEYFWQNPTPPVAGSLAYPQQWQFDEQTPQLFGQPDEDFWQNPTAPVAGSLLWPQQASFDEQFPTLFGQMDEDFWTPQIPAQLWSVPVQAFSDDAIIVQQPVTFQPDEDFWSPQIPPQPWSVPPQAITSDEIVPQPSTQVVDELFFAPLLTCTYPNFILQQWQFETGDNGGLTPPPVVIQRINILRWASTGSRMTPPYNP